MINNELNASSNHSTSSYSTTASQKHLRFGNVEILDMPMELGEHPPSQGGPSLTIGWEAESRRSTNVDLYEMCKFGRERCEFHLSPNERASILLRAGYSTQDIVTACNEAELTLKQREATIKNQKWEFLHVASESAGRKLKKMAIRANPAA